MRRPTTSASPRSQRSFANNRNNGEGFCVEEEKLRVMGHRL